VFRLRGVLLTPEPFDACAKPRRAFAAAIVSGSAKGRQRILASILYLPLYCKRGRTHYKALKQDFAASKDQSAGYNPAAVGPTGQIRPGLAAI
jgi:hypothetical protein